jgi:hypothetical protein
VTLTYNIKMCHGSNDNKTMIRKNFKERNSRIHTICKSPTEKQCLKSTKQSYSIPANMSLWFPVFHQQLVMGISESPARFSMVCTVHTL